MCSLHHYKCEPCYLSITEPYIAEWFDGCDFEYTGEFRSIAHNFSEFFDNDHGRIAFTWSSQPRWVVRALLNKPIYVIINNDQHQAVKQVRGIIGGLLVFAGGESAYLHQCKRICKFQLYGNPMEAF